MGRPLDEKLMGDFSNLGSQFTVQCFIKGDTRRNTGSILRQKNSRKFEIQSGSHKGFCQLVTREPNEGEMSIVMKLTNLIEGTGASFKVIMGVDQVTINNAGSNYVQGDEVTLDDFGSIYDEMVTFEILTVNGSGGITSIRVKSGQQGKFSALPSLTNCNLVGGSGTSGTVDTTYKVMALDILNAGSDYTELEVKFAQGDATCNPRIINGKVSNVVITNGGLNYTSVPGLIITPTAGSEFVKRITSGEAFLLNGTRQHF